jgi:hypothetical protein
MEFKKLEFKRHHGLPGERHIYIKCLKCSVMVNSYPESGEFYTCSCGNIELDGADYKANIKNYDLLEIYSLLDDLSEYPPYIGKVKAEPHLNTENPTSSQNPILSTALSQNVVFTANFPYKNVQ